MKTTETVTIADFRTEINEGPLECEAGILGRFVSVYIV
jgi:hypothetical protein